MISLLVANRVRRLWPCVAYFLVLAFPGHGAMVQVASGTPVEQTATNVVRVPLYFYTDDVITAGQFDISVPEGWEVLQVDGSAAYSGGHAIEADALDSGGVRVVLFSLNNSELPVGSLGTVLLEPPSVGQIANLTFSNPLFVNDGGSILGITPGFPTLQVVSQPLGQTVLSGQRALLTVSALAIDPTFNWYAGLAGDTSNPVGSNAALFQTPPLSADADYWVRITDTFGEMVDSQVAHITVDTGPTYIFAPNSRSVGWLAGSGAAALSTPAGNSWAATSSAPWLVVGTPSGTGPGSIAYTFTTNTTYASRSAQISVGGVTYTVTQSARPSLFADYPPVAAGSPWRWVPWFGYISDTYFPWVYHHDHGWLWIVPTLDQSKFFAYSAEGDLGWLFISTRYYNANVRWVYSYQYQSYLLFFPVDTLNPTSRLFYHANEERWITYPEE